ncbi:transcription elongation factor GreA [Paenibacillus chungangensis]|uniref:Transcription elongation factor GreA n=1 Tax=Paenibacillus chungangensis TaxID=696535 RepID=A0ABW3HP92_9BACL
MAKEEMILTPEGYAKIEAELEELKTVKRKELSERLKVAISFGDLRENSEYHSAKDDQAFLETKILQLERMLKTAKVVDVSSAGIDKVGVGAVVTLHDVEFNERIQYQLVSPAEADVEADKISYESPLGKELMGKKVGDAIHVSAPMGMIEYKLLEIKTI